MICIVVRFGTSFCGAFGFTFDEQFSPLELTSEKFCLFSCHTLWKMLIQVCPKNAVQMQTLIAVDAADVVQSFEAGHPSLCSRHGLRNVPN